MIGIFNVKYLYMGKYPIKYLPDKLSKEDKDKYRRELNKSRKAYKRGKYYTRKKVKSYDKKESGHIKKAKKIYRIDTIKPSRKLSKVTGCSVNGLNAIVKKGQGAYYSGGSRPNQTAHSWGIARLASSITGGKAAAVDFKILEDSCKKNSKALRMARTAKKKHGYGKRKVRKVNGGKKRTKKKSSLEKQFTPNINPKQMFKMGSFGGTYWRPIYSGVTKKKYKNVHKKYPKSWWQGIPENHLSSAVYDKAINKYNVKVGTTLKFWESKDWIKDLHPYGWVHWYCDYYQGKRGPDDERQIKRWLGVAGSRGRFMRFLVTLILKKGGKWDDETISPKIRQTLLHWGYKLTKSDFNREVKRRNSK